jgi:hypothetical protein
MDSIKILFDINKISTSTVLDQGLARVPFMQHL